MPVRLNGSTSGYVDIAAPAVAGTTTVTLPSSSSTLLSSVGDQTTSGTFVMSSPYTMRNKIINGAMVIDQRNAGASTTPTAIGSAVYALDRWATYASQASKFSIQQNAGSVTPATGFSSYIGITSLSAYTVGVSDYFILGQKIEGLNVADLAWGTASAKTVTISFWVRSSLTGTFGGVLTNSAQNRTYPFTYTINATNTWEQKSITIAGDTTGTWLTTNGVGVWINFGLGCGTSQSGTSGVWASSSALSATGAVSVVGTNAATWYVTGVQLEIGTAATPFEYRNYQQELAMCQRYYFKNNSLTSYAPIGVGRAYSGTNGNAAFYLPVSMRSNPTLGYSSLSHIDIVGLGTATAIQNDGAALSAVKVGWARPSGATAGAFYQIELGNGTNYYVDFSAEL